MQPKIHMFVKQIIQETPSVKRFVLVSKEGADLPAFSAGSHISTFLNTAAGTLERHYSLVQAPAITDQYEIAVQLHSESQGGSAYWHHQVSEGTELFISYPKNHFPLSFRAKHHVFYAAGIGITPFLSMMAELVAQGRSFELHYAAKSREMCAFYETLQRTYTDSCHFYLSADPNSTRVKPDDMRQQRVGTHVYFCGPETMVNQFQEAARSYGYPEQNIHFELFAPPSPVLREPFLAELCQSKRTISVGRDQSLLEALLAAGIKSPYSCRVGRCGTCAVEVLSGEVAHYDSVLSEKERAAQDVMMTCVSRAVHDKLVLRL